MKPGMEGHSFPQPPAANYPNLAGVASGEKPQHASCTCLRVAGDFFVEDVNVFFFGTKNMTLRSAKTAGTSKREGGS